MTAVQRLVANGNSIINFLKEFSSNTPKDVSVDWINDDGAVDTKTFANIKKFQDSVNLANDGGVIKDLDGNGLSIENALKLGGKSLEEVLNSTSEASGKNQCTAWVDFDGADGTIRDSYNIESVVRDATGEYTINFSADMDTVNYAISASGEQDSYVGVITGSKAVSSFGIRCQNDVGTKSDDTYISAQIFGGKA